ncbi:MarR family transcriptional regulator [Brevibacillus ruminantium]|uniref:MarR family transcriptional regulator n=1 Tax=Brevibacillus ruminantium TaxID=2950604 RepID=A0ABY4WGX7_9BACL|nr:MarR family transcriptional regulator [Brevibacillus ruminantium]USG66410.1 MarR family transcriptional regulator [Brevibacillus ruminantium]
MDVLRYESIGFLLGVTYRRISHFVSIRLRELDLTPEQFAVLLRLREQDGINQKEIAARTAKDQPTTARILDVLLRKELIEKKVSEADRRAFLIYLTEKGKAFTEQAIPLEEQALKEMLAGIDPEHLQLFKEILLTIQTNINQDITE